MSQDTTAAILTAVGTFAFGTLYYGIEPTTAAIGAAAIGVAYRFATTYVDRLLS